MGSKSAKSGSKIRHFVGDFGPFLGRSGVTLWSLGNILASFCIILVSFWSHFEGCLALFVPFLDDFCPFSQFLRSFCVFIFGDVCAQPVKVCSKWES